MWLIAAVPHNGIPYAQIGFIIVLQIFSLFSMLSLEFRLVSQYICLPFIRILSIIDLVCRFHVCLSGRQTWMRLKGKALASLITIEDVERKRVKNTFDAAFVCDRWKKSNNRWLD